MKKSIKQQFFFPHAPAIIWDYLTKPELLELWIMKNDFQPVEGYEFQFKINPIPALDFDGIFYCRVLEIVPLQRLSYTWNSGPGNGKITLESVVEWRLEQKNGGTELLLDHSGFEKEENLDFYNGLIGGWSKNLQKMADRLNAGSNEKTSA